MANENKNEKINRMFVSTVKNFDNNMKIVIEFTKNVDEQIETKLKPDILKRNNETVLQIEDRFELIKHLCFVSLYKEEVFLKLAKRLIKEEFNPEDVNKIDLLNKITNNLFLDCDFTVKIENEYKYSISANKNINLIKLQDYLDSFSNEKINLVKNKILLSKSIIISLLNNVETTFRDILKILVIRNPGLMKPEHNNSTFGKISYFELIEIEDIKEAQNIIIDDYIDNKMYGSIEDWIKFIMHDFKEEKKQIFRKIFSRDDEDYLKDFAQLRNIIVHNNGKVNKQFLAKYSKKGYRKDDEIILSTDEVFEYINNIYLVMSKLIFAVWFTLYEKKTMIGFIYSTI